MSLEMTGKIAKILDAQSGTSKTGKEWKKQSFVLDNGAKYNPEVCFNLFGDDKVALFNDLQVGDEIEVLFNLSSREYNGNYYTSADVWKLQRTNVPPSVAEADAAYGNDDLPF